MTSVLNLRFTKPNLDFSEPLHVDEAMSLAIHEAYKGAGFVSPNPQVGCVILDAQNKFLSSGYHEKYGGPHAEVNALKNLKPEQLHGAHVIVTLEPCAHEGKTPSCAKALAKLPVRKITYGLKDPNPLVAGEGANILRAAGKEVEVFSSANPQYHHELQKVCEVFLRNFIQKEIFVSLKIAQSLDGHMNLANDESKWITGEDSRQQVHLLRAQYDMTAIGIGTFLKDDPSLNVRHSAINKQNKVLVIDPAGRGLKEPRLAEKNLFKNHDAKNIFWCVSQDLETENRNDVQILKVKKNHDGVDLRSLHQKLWDHGVRSVMIEGGPSTVARYLQEKLAHRLHLFQAPIILGSQGQKSWSGQSTFQNIPEAPRLFVDEQNFFGHDTYISGLLS